MNNRLRNLYPAVSFAFAGINREEVSLVMGKRKKSKMEFRYYKMPVGIPVLAMLGEDWVRPYGAGIDFLHFHNCMEIGYCYGGHGILTIGEKDYYFTGNQFSVIPQNCPHTTTSDTGTVSRWEYLFIDASEILYGLYPNDCNEKRVKRIIQRVNSRGVFKDACDSPELAARVRQTLDIIRSNDEFCLEEAKGILTAFLTGLARENKDDLQDVEDEQNNAIVSEALHYINSHYMEQIRIETLAKHCHISETHFRRVFSSCMAMGPLEYINLIRIQNACELLRKTDALVSDIAFRCGFPALSTFNRNFKQILGESPNEWRKNPENFEQQIFKFEIHSEEGW